MKKLLALVFALLSLTATADPIRVPTVWGWIPTSTQGNYIRAILEEANKNQSKYEFVFENRAGAGSSIAAQYVLSQSGLAILPNGTAQFIRPFLYPELSYKLSDFKPVMIMGSSPAVLVTKNKSMEQLLKQNKINFATSGKGSTAHLIAEALAKDIKKQYPKKDIEMIHYTSSNEGFLSVMGGHTDAVFEFLGDARGKATPDTRLVGLTGKNSIDGIPTMATLGYPELTDLQATFAFYVPAKTPQATVDELQQIFLKAEQIEQVQRMYKLDYATKEAYMSKPGDLNKWYGDMTKKFESYTNGIQVK